MFRLDTPERDNWRRLADEFGFKFHTMHGQAYWDERAYYQFTLKQIEDDIEAPSEELHQMCLDVVDHVVRDESLLGRFCIPHEHWDLVRESWILGEPSLYSRFDFAYSGQGPAKFYENNADTPTSLYETGFWQWLWLENKVDSGSIVRHADQYNSLQEKLVNRFFELAQIRGSEVLHLACCKDTEEDRGTVQYLEDCANEAGIKTKFVYVEDIGHGEGNVLTDLDDQVITWLFKLYPWEFMFREQYGELLSKANVSFIEPAWKSILSNKALLPMLWKFFPNHPNLLPSYFEEDLKNSGLKRYVRKPIFAREGANVSIHVDGNTLYESEGPYGEEGFIYQEYHPLPKFGENYTLIGSWLINDKPGGISIREDSKKITQDLSRYLPHVIVG
jgi:glutathionylspermidine synthase